MRSCSPTGWPKAVRTGAPSRCGSWPPAGTCRRGALDALLRHLVDEGREGLLLLTLSGAAKEQGARGRALRPGALLPSRRSPQADDVLVYERKDLPGWLIGGDRHRGRPLPADRDGRRLGQREPPLLRGPRQRRWRRTSARRVKPVIESDDAEYAPIGNYRRRWCTCDRTRTRQTARSSRSTCATRRPSAWKTIVPEQKEALEGVGIIGGRVVAQYLVDVQSRLRLFGLDGARAGRDRAARHRDGGGSCRTRGRPGHLVRVQLAAGAIDRVSLRPGDEAEPALRGRRRRPMDASAVRDGGRVRDVEGRHPRAVFPDGQEEPAARRQQPDDDLRLRRLLGDDAPDLSRGRAGVAGAGRRLGDRQHARRRGVPARPGTGPGCWRRSRTSSTTSSPSRST